MWHPIDLLYVLYNSFKLGIQIHIIELLIDQETRKKDLKNIVKNVRQKRSVLRQKSPPSMKNKKQINRSKKSMIPFKKHMISKLPISEKVKEQKVKVTSKALSGEQAVVSDNVDDNSNKTTCEKTISSNSTTDGKAEIVIDSMKPSNKLQKSMTKMNGKPIGMQFLYQADKLTCVVKCHTKVHLEEAQKRVC